MGIRDSFSHFSVNQTKFRWSVDIVPDPEFERFSYRFVFNQTRSRLFCYHEELDFQVLILRNQV